MFHKTVKNIMPNYIPHETFTFDVRDPPWINKDIKQLILDIMHTNLTFAVINLCCSLINFSFFKQSSAL